MSLFGFLRKKPPEPRGALQIVQDEYSVSVMRTVVSGEILHNRIDFGDGVIGWDNPMHAIMNHTYGRAGNYVLSLIVVDRFGRVSEFNQVITIPKGLT